VNRQIRSNTPNPLHSRCTRQKKSHKPLRDSEESSARKHLVS
jgi:hypothetical protein